MAPWIVSLMLAGITSQPADPFTVCARDALRGCYGPLQDWQHQAYARGLAQGVTAEQAFVMTQYNGDEPDGKVDGRGLPCTLRVAASNRIPRYRYIWTEASGVRQILDCGSRRNDMRVRKLAETHGWPANAVWVDVWWPTARHARQKGFDGWKLQMGAVIP